MQPIAFDSLTYVHMLEQAGVPRVQAEAQAQAQVFFIQHLVKQFLTTNEDISGISNATVESRQEIEQFRSEIKENIKTLDLKIELINSQKFRWLMLFLIGQTALVAAIVKFVR